MGKSFDELREKYQVYVSINRTGLEEEFDSLPSFIEDASFDFAKAAEDADVYKARLEALISQRREIIRESLQEAGVKVSETRLSSEVDADKEVVKARERLANLNAIVDYMKGVLKSLDVKCQMLVALNNALRSERQSLKNL